MPSNRRVDSAVANRRDSASCSAARMLTPYRAFPASAAYSDAAWSTQTCTSGGHRLTEQNALTVIPTSRSEEHTSELQSQSNLVCRLLLEKKKKKKKKKKRKTT